MNCVSLIVPTNTVFISSRFNTFKRLDLQTLYYTVLHKICAHWFIFKVVTQSFNIPRDEKLLYYVIYFLNAPDGFRQYQILKLLICTWNFDVFEKKLTFLRCSCRLRVFHKKSEIPPTCDIFSNSAYPHF